MKRLLSIYNKVSWLFLITVGSILFGLAFYFIYWKPPGFYPKLQESVTENQELMKIIGGWKESQFKCADSLTSNNPFKLTIIGECDSSSLVIKGFYTGNDYTVTDTIIRKCK